MLIAWRCELGDRCWECSRVIKIVIFFFLVVSRSFTFPPHRIDFSLYFSLVGFTNQIVDSVFRPSPYCSLWQGWPSIVVNWIRFSSLPRGLSHFIVVPSLEAGCTLWPYINIYRFCTAIDIAQTRIVLDLNFCIKYNSRRTPIDGSEKLCCIWSDMFFELHIIYRITISYCQRVAYL